MNAVVHINGFPGSGKLTIARALAPAIGARVIDNHTLMNPAGALFDRRQRLHGELRAEIRALVLRYARKVDAGVPLIFTDALSDDDWDAGIFADYAELARARGSRLHAVVIECAAAENEVRLTAPGRGDLGKLASVETLRSLRSGLVLLRGCGDDTLVVDNTALAPSQVAARIVSHFGLTRV